MSGMAGFQEVGVLLYQRPDDRQLPGNLLFAEYYKPTFIRLKEISAGFARASSSQAFLAANQSSHAKGISCGESVYIP